MGKKSETQNKEHHLHIIKHGSGNKVPQNAEKKQNLMKEMKRINKNETLRFLSLWKRESNEAVRIKHSLGGEMRQKRESKR